MFFDFGKEAKNKSEKELLRLYLPLLVTVNRPKKI